MSECRVVAHRDILRRCAILDAFGVEADVSGRAGCQSVKKKFGRSRQPSPASRRLASWPSWRCDDGRPAAIFVGVRRGMRTGKDDQSLAALPFRTQDAISDRVRTGGYRATANCQKECHDAEHSRPSPDELHSHSSGFNVQSSYMHSDDYYPKL